MSPQPKCRNGAHWISRAWTRSRWKGTRNGIEIVNDNNPYLALLGIDWATDMNGVINLKKHKIIFEKMSLRVVVPLDLTEGVRYIVPMHDDELDCIYKITTRE